MSHTTTGQGCNLNVISVRESAAGEGTTPYTALYHLGWFTGLDQVKVGVKSAAARAQA